MREEWTNKLKDSLSGYEESVPDGLWGDIESTLAGISKTQSPPVRKKRVSPFVRLVYAVTATAAAVFLGYMLFSGKPEHHVGDAPVASAPVTGPVPAGVNAGTAQGKDAVAVAVNVANSVRHALLDSFSTGKVQELPVTACDTSALAEAAATVPQETGKNTTLPPATTGKGHGMTRPAIKSKSYNVSSPRHDSGISFSLYAQNLPVSSSRQQLYSRPMMLCVQSDNSYDAGNSVIASPGIGLMYTKNATDITAKKHRFPVRGGVSVRYSLNDRVGIETGVTYTRLTSHFTSGSGTRHNETEQKLHYIGIPLNVSYALWHNSRWDAYLSAGVEVQKCVSGKSDTESVVNGTVISHEEGSIKDDKLQWSASTAAGMQFNIVPAVGIYVEPGVSWTPDNGSNVETIYKDKPLNLNIKVGVRVKIK